MSNIVINRENIEQKILHPYEPIMQYLLDYSSKWETLGVDLTSHIYRIFDEAYLNAQDHSVKALPNLYARHSRRALLTPISARMTRQTIL